MSGYTGEYFEHTSEGAKPSVYYTFTPKSLMNNDFYSIDEELSSLLIETHRVLGKLDGMIMYMPDSEILRE